jgi:hypothetical protein
MKVNTKSYPHPVLGNQDDLGGLFKADFTYTLGKEHIILSPNFSLKNSAIEDLIKKKKALFTLELQCPSTFFRTSFSTFNPNEEFKILEQRVRERITVNFYICATQDILGYIPSDPHADYEGATFDIEAGEVLATEGQCTFYAEKSFDPLRPPVSSFMSIQMGSQHEGPLQVDYESEKITIVLSKADWKNYLQVRSQALTEGTLHSSIVLPVLIDAIHKIQNNGNEYEAMNWYSRLETILAAKGLHDKEPLEAAQKILENPVERSFRGINSLLEPAHDQEYE